MEATTLVVIFSVDSALFILFAATGGDEVPMELFGLSKHLG
jgi:hypothetical protein